MICNCSAIGNFSVPMFPLIYHQLCPSSQKKALSKILSWRRWEWGGGRGALSQARLGHSFPSGSEFSPHLTSDESSWSVLMGWFKACPWLLRKLMPQRIEGMSPSVRHQEINLSPHWGLPACPVQSRAGNQQAFAEGLQGICPGGLLINCHHSAPSAPLKS